MAGVQVPFPGSVRTTAAIWRVNGNNPYHGAANAFTDGDDGINEINESITNIHLAHNANTEATSTEIAALRAEVAATRQAMVATQQQMALMAQSSPQMQTQHFPAWPPAYPAAYQQPPMQQPIPLAPVPQAAYAAIPPPAPPGVSTSYGISTSTGIRPTRWRWRRQAIRR